MKKNIKIFVIASLIFLFVDGIWLGFVALPLYQNQIGHLMKQVLLTPAVIFYVIYVVGLMVFVINDELKSQDIWRTVGKGFLFGVVCYSTYDLTNMATIKDWTWMLSSVDIVWGGFVSALTATLSVLIYRKGERK